MKIKKLLLLSLLFIFGCSHNCNIEQDKIQKVALPALEKIVDYTKTKGIPKSLNEIKGFPFKDNYEFRLTRSQVTSNLDLDLEVVHNCTECIYTIYKDEKLFLNYKNGRCFEDKHYSTWFRQ